MKKFTILFSILFLGLFSACDSEDDAVYVPEVIEESNDPISIYFRDNFLDVYGTAVRWKWDDNLVDDTKRVTPALRDLCIPMGDFIKDFWLAPFNMTEAGNEFMNEHFPPEIVFVGSPMWEPDGMSKILGYADAGARITFTEVNDFDLTNTTWLLQQLRTAEHEYGHIIHQRHNLPDGWKEVSPENYKSNNWLNLAGDVQASNPRISREAITLGMVSNYGTLDVQEDFCELLSLYITSDKAAFEERYLTHEPEAKYAQLDADGNPVLDKDGDPILLDPAADATEINAGRDIIAVKLKMIKDYYMEKFEIDLDQIRDEIMRKIAEITK
ncbi:substrate import-associated zinc metallohydrolase lipoprotein [Labilibaculum euxinus]